jgi:hypothetical protein
MGDHVLMRGTDGVVYKIPTDVASKHALSKPEAQKLFAEKKSSSHGVAHPEQVPDFHVLLQTEYK